MLWRADPTASTYSIIVWYLRSHDERISEGPNQRPRQAQDSRSGLSAVLREECSTKGGNVNLCVALVVFVLLDKGLELVDVLLAQLLVQLQTVRDLPVGTYRLRQDRSKAKEPGARRTYIAEEYFLASWLIKSRISRLKTSNWKSDPRQLVPGLLGG
jgi:hypothetical protein